MYGYTKTTQAFDKDSRLTAVHNREVCPALKEKKYSRPINWPEYFAWLYEEKTTFRRERFVLISRLQSLTACTAPKHGKYSRPINWPVEKYLQGCTKTRQAFNKDSCLTTVHIR